MSFSTAATKPGQKPTFHRDGTVSYWSVYQQAWKRQNAALIPDRELAAMTPKQRTRAMKAVSR